MEKVEKRAATELLQKPSEITIGGRKFIVAAPSSATIIQVSEYIGELPPLDPEAKNVLYETLAYARDCWELGSIAATIIIGAGKLIKPGLFGLPRRYYRRRYEKLKHFLLAEIPPDELREAVFTLLQRLRIADFFGLTASLIEINLLRQTREAVTTVHGHQSQE